MSYLVTGTEPPFDVVPTDKRVGFSLLAFVFGVLTLALTGFGCAFTPAGPCVSPQAAFPTYVDGGIESVGCGEYMTEDTGEKITMCLVKTKDHGIIHKRLPTRSCWRAR